MSTIHNKRTLTSPEHGPRDDFIVGVAKGQILPQIYKYAYTKMAPIEVFEGASGGRGPQAPLHPTSSAYGPEISKNNGF